MKKPKPILIDLLYEAMTKDYGIVVETNDPKRLQGKLALERRADPMLKNISVFLSPTNPAGELWLVKMPEKSDAEEI